MSGQSVLSPLAQGDIEKIWTSTAERWGIAQAETYVRQIGRHIEMVADRPSIGSACLEVRAGYFKYPSGSHVLFYRQAKEGIDVVRILHERMDFKQHL